MNIELIVAIDKHGGFGKKGKIPWHHSKDLKRFKNLTMDHYCVMGRKTYEDMLEMVIARGKKKKDIASILPGRICFVVTSKKNFKTPGAIKVKSIQDAIGHIPDTLEEKRLFIIGGERMYKEGMKIADTLHITWVPGEYDCDKFFPIDQFVGNSPYRLKSQQEDGELIFTTYERREDSGAASGEDRG